MSEPKYATGMVLSATPIGEYDRRVVLLTREYGKISAFAKGARRPKSQLVAATNPFVTGTFEIYEGRDSFTVYSASIDNYFNELTADLDSVWYGYYFLELADYFALVYNDESERLVLLYKALLSLQKKRISNELIRVIYEFKTLMLYGEYPSDFDDMNISDSAKYALWYMIKTPCEKAYTFDVKNEVCHELFNIIKHWYRKYIRHDFKSLEFLDL